MKGTGRRMQFAWALSKGRLGDGKQRMADSRILDLDLDDMAAYFWEMGLLDYCICV